MVEDGFHRRSRISLRQKRVDSETNGSLSHAKDIDRRKSHRHPHGNTPKRSSRTACLPSSQSYRTSCSVPTKPLTDPQGYPASLLAQGRTRLSCAAGEERIQRQSNSDVICGRRGSLPDRDPHRPHHYRPIMNSPRTRIIFVSSNSCCTRIIVSACRGSWNF